MLRNGALSYKLPLQSDPRRWLPNGVLTTINEQLVLPHTIAEGTYQMYLYMPDAYASIADNPRYAVRFANTGVWDEETGMNRLNASVTVTTDVVLPCCNVITLPDTLNKENVSNVSDDMTWYNNTYFDFGPDDAPNTERWADWEVNLAYPGRYIVTEDVYCTNGHSWQLQLINEQSETVSAYTTEGRWDMNTITYDAKWDLSDMPAGIYRLRVNNAMEWGQPKLRSLILTYDGIIPTDYNAVTNVLYEEKSEYYDILGRPVDENARGVLITKNKKIIK